LSATPRMEGRRDRKVGGVANARRMRAGESISEFRRSCYDWHVSRFLLASMTVGVRCK
jgi:hypothetical protein